MVGVPEILKTDDRPLLTLLRKAFDTLEEEELAGSCTASLALFTADGKLHVLNVGDSGALAAACSPALSVLSYITFRPGLHRLLSSPPLFAPLLCSSSFLSLSQPCASNPNSR